MPPQTTPVYRLAAQILLRRGSQTLLLKRQNTGYEDGKYGLPTGHIEFGESVKSAAIRQAKEEIGVDIEESDLDVFGVMHRIKRVTYVDFFLTCQKWSGEISNREPEKCSELVWTDLDDLPPNMVPYVAIGISLGEDSMWFHQLEA
jgi:ADP-ribose pyrophosphatase YjhB (NUDIX family)